MCAQAALTEEWLLRREPTNRSPQRLTHQGFRRPCSRLLHSFGCQTLAPDVANDWPTIARKVTSHEDLVAPERPRAWISNE